MYIFRGRGVFIDVYEADDKIATSGATLLADIDLRRTYRAIDSVATGRIPSLFCGCNFICLVQLWFARFVLERPQFSRFFGNEFRGIFTIPTFCCACEQTTRHPVFYMLIRIHEA